MCKQRYVRTLRTLGKAVFSRVETEKAKKFAQDADFFGCPGYKIPKKEDGWYVCLPQEAEVISDGRYLFPEEGLAAQAFPKSRVYYANKELIVLGELTEDVVFFAVDKGKEDEYYRYLVLYSAFLSERDKQKKQEQKRLLQKGTNEEIGKELGKKENKTVTSLFIGYPSFPPLYCLPDEWVHRLLENAGETVCFPQGGVWSGIVPTLQKEGIKNVILPPQEGLPSSFCWKVGEEKINVFCGDIISPEKKKFLAVASGYRNYPLVQKAELPQPTEERIGELFPLSDPVIFPSKKRRIDDRGKGESLRVNEGAIDNGTVSVRIDKNGFTVKNRDAATFLFGYYNKEKIRRCGVTAQRTYISGKYAVLESHIYFRNQTARVRVLLESESRSVHVDFIGAGDFLLMTKKDDFKKIICSLPLHTEGEYPVKEGTFYAREKMTFVAEGKEDIHILGYGLKSIIKKETIGLFLRGKGEENSLIID